jgi:hypothetical protein
MSFPGLRRVLSKPPLHAVRPAEPAVSAREAGTRVITTAAPMFQEVMDIVR